jgi:hypothetical protein
VNPFASWTAGQPWWVTLLLLPAIVLAAVVARVLRDVLLAALAAIGLAIAVVLVAWRRRRR